MSLKQIKCAPRYYVSDAGEVFSTCSGEMKKLKPAMGTTGYEFYSLREDGKYIQKDIHRLVAEAFLPNPDNLPYVNHIDGNKLNAHVSNLEWCTPKHNHTHAVQTGLIKDINGEGNPANVYSEDKIKEVCSLMEKGFSNKEIGEMIPEVAISTISSIRLKDVWVSVSCKYNIPRLNRDKLTDEDVIQICEHINNGVPIKDISDMFSGYPERYIRGIRDGVRYKKLSKKYIKVQRSS